MTDVPIAKSPEFGSSSFDTRAARSGCRPHRFLDADSDFRADENREDPCAGNSDVSEGESGIARPSAFHGDSLRGRTLGKKTSISWRSRHTVLQMLPRSGHSRRRSGDDFSTIGSERNLMHPAVAHRCPWARRMQPREIRPLVRPPHHRSTSPAREPLEHRPRGSTRTPLRAGRVGGVRLSDADQPSLRSLYGWRSASAARVCRRARAAPREVISSLRLSELYRKRFLIERLQLRAPRRRSRASSIRQPSWQAPSRDSRFRAGGRRSVRPPPIPAPRALQRGEYLLPR